jgi:hypothetical protein
MEAEESCSSNQNYFLLLALLAEPIHSRPRQGTEFNPERSYPGPAREHTLFPNSARLPQSSEPILVPKLRIRFADFPYLHCSIDQRLLTSETCCGYGYELVRHSRKLLPDFQGPVKHLRRHNNCDALRNLDPISP